MDDRRSLSTKNSYSSKLKQPYRQRFLQIVPSPYSQTIQSITYRPRDLQPWINFCQQPAPKRIVQPSELGPAICVVYLKQQGETYWGSTPVDGCLAQVWGAIRIKNQILLHAQGMDTWDRGYDNQGKQVWGAKDEAYQYRWVSQTDR